MHGDCGLRAICKGGRLGPASSKIARKALLSDTPPPAFSLLLGRRPESKSRPGLTSLKCQERVTPLRMALVANSRKMTSLELLEKRPTNFDAHDVWLTQAEKTCVCLCLAVATPRV